MRSRVFPVLTLKDGQYKLSEFFVQRRTYQRRRPHTIVDRVDGLITHKPCTKGVRSPLQRAAYPAYRDRWQSPLPQQIRVAESCPRRQRLLALGRLGLAVDVGAKAKCVR